MNTMYFEDCPPCPQEVDITVESMIEQPADEQPADFSSMEVKEIIRMEILSGNTHIHMPKGTRYLSEVLDKLPKNCILNKGNAGCGGTSVALCNSENYIVCVPNVNLIKNKLEQAKDWGTQTSIYKHEVFGVYNRNEVSDENIVDYLERNKNNPKKILVTYDSLNRLNDFINPSEYSILIDEYHTFLHAYLFRNDAIQKVLANYNKYQFFTFMSATPIPEKFILNELSNIPMKSIVWANPNTYNLKMNYCKGDLVSPLVKLIKKFLDGSRNGNLYLFVNSVKIIEAIIDHPELLDMVNEDNCKTIYSENNIRKLRIKRSFIDSTYKKINIITSVGFEGIDIDDENGVTVVATNANHEHTLIGISTTLIQIAGRLRKSRYSGNIEVYCKFKANQNTMSFETYSKLIEIEKNASIEKIRVLNDKLTDKKYKKSAQSTYLNKDFIKRNDMGLFHLDENAIKHELYKYHLSKCIYSSGESVTREIGANGIFTVLSESTIEIKGAKSTKLSSNLGIAVDTIRSLDEKTGFIGNMNNYASPEKRWDKLSDEEIRTIQDIENRYPYIWDAIKYIGYDRMARLKYNTSNIRKALIKHRHKSKPAAIVEHLKSKDLEGKTVTNRELKKLFQNIYDDINLSCTAKATDIEEYYNIDTKTIKGQRVTVIGPMKKLL